MIHGVGYLLDADLATAYGVETRVLNQAIRRKAQRFPPDFAFRLTRVEVVEIQRSRSQLVILKRGQNVKYPPLAFTEHGAMMAAILQAIRQLVLPTVRPKRGIGFNGGPG